MTSNPVCQSSSTLPPGRAKSCTSCRQLACDAKKTFPSACSRCTKLSLDCRMDASFKRVPTRKRIEEITRELNDLRAAVDLSRAPVTRAGFEPHSTEEHQHESLPGASPSLNQTADLNALNGASASWLQLDRSQEIESRSLERIILTSQTVLELLENFEQHFYHHLPILEAVKSTSALVESSPLLFWTILLVSCQWHPTLSYLYGQMIAPHETLLAPLFHNAIHSLQTIHALLILCHWPVPQITQARDPSWNYIGLVISAAMQLNLHQPLKKPESFDRYVGWYTSSLHGVSTQVKALTWLSCFNINVQISSFIGVPPHFCASSQLDQIQSICREAEPVLPRSFVAHTEILRQIGRYTLQLDGIHDTRAQQSLASLLDRELDSLKASYQDVWSPELEITFQGAKVYLYALCFAIEQSLATNAQFNRPQIPTSSQLVLQQGLASASCLINTFSDLLTSTTSLESTKRHSPHAPFGGSQLLSYPKHYFAILFFAAIFLLKFLVAQPHVSRSDRQLAINHITSCHRIFTVFACSRDHKRAAFLIEVLGRMTCSGSLYAGLNISNRLGASLMYDATLTTNLFLNRDQQTGQLAPAHSWLKLNDVASLPPAPEQSLNYTAALTSNGRSELNAGTSENTLETYMQMDQDLMWSLWDNDVYDALAMGTV